MLCCCCCAVISIGLLFSKRLDTDLLRQSGFTRPHVIAFVADLFFSTLESGFKNIRIRCRIRRMLVDGSCIPNEKVADSEVSFGRGVKLPTHSYMQATVTWYVFSFFLCSKHFLPLLASFLARIIFGSSFNRRV